MSRTAVPGFTTLLDIDQIERWLAGGARRPSFRVIKVGSAFAEHEYTRSMRMGGTPVDGVADFEKISRLVARGATVVGQNLEFVFPAIRRLVDSLTPLVSHPVQANAYLTPPSAEGLARHADSHDVFILHVSGTKSWEVDGLGELVMRPADVLYIPQGTPHVARTSSDTSLHITLGLISVTTRSVLRRMVGRLDSVVDEALPIGYAQLTDRELCAVLRPRLQEAIESLTSADLATVARMEIDRSKRLSSPSARSSLTTTLELMDLHRETRLRRLTKCQVQVHGERVILHLPEWDVSFPVAATLALERFATSDTLSVADLVGVDDASKIVVARRLIREHAAAVVDATGDERSF